MEIVSESVILIGGGVGPLAGVMLHQKIIEATKNDSGDAGHLSVIHVSRSASIPDRTQYLLEQPPGETASLNPGTAMAAVFAEACRGLRPGESAVGGVPCNTFHAPEIFGALLDELERLGASVRIVNMGDALVDMMRCAWKESAGKRVGVLSTTGTRAIGLFDTLFEPLGCEVVYVPETEQARLHDAIYHPEWGLKSVYPPAPEAHGTVLEMADMLIRSGAECVISGCTELPFVLSSEEYGGVPVIDPVRALAVALVREAAPEKLLEPVVKAR